MMRPTAPLDTPLDPATGLPLSLHQRRCVLGHRAATLIKNGEIEAYVRAPGQRHDPTRQYLVKITGTWQRLTLKETEALLAEIWNGRA